MDDVIAAGDPGEAGPIRVVGGQLVECGLTPLVDRERLGNPAVGQLFAAPQEHFYERPERRIGQDSDLRAATERHRQCGVRSPIFLQGEETLSVEALLPLMRVLTLCRTAC